jgi:hypothetical protein
LLGATVGTVDKFQAQEAAVIIYSMTTSTPEDAPIAVFLPSRASFSVTGGDLIVVVCPAP